jgi:hypothetical protein
VSKGVDAALACGYREKLTKFGNMIKWSTCEWKLIVLGDWIRKLKDKEATLPGIVSSQKDMVFSD